VELCEKYDQTLKDIGVFKESQLARMADAALFSDILMNLQDGIKDQSDAKLEKFYRENDLLFQESPGTNSQIATVFRKIISWNALHGGPLMKTYTFYSLFLAITHAMFTVPNLTSFYDFGGPIELNEDFLVPNLSTLAAALDQPDAYPNLRGFVVSCAEATTRFAQRSERFKWFCRALKPQLLE
jgi:hypothetical protein